MTTYATHYYCRSCCIYILHEDAIAKGNKETPRCPKCNQRLRIKPRHPQEYYKRRSEVVKEQRKMRTKK